MAEPADAEGMLRALSEHGIRFVVIGGLAGNAWGSPTVTYDLDICYARDQANLEKLAAALRDLGATLRGAPDDLPFRLDATTLKLGDSFTFKTRLGDLDCLGTPTGTLGFDELDRTAVRGDLRGVSVRVVALEDLIRMKRAAGRPKDLIEAEVLGALRRELEEQGKLESGLAPHPPVPP